MNIFETELKKGNFVIGECPKCKMVIWPPSDYCSKCFENVKWKNSNSIGKLIEFSKKDNAYFCITEFEEKIRIMGSLRNIEHEPKIGQKVKLERCSMTDNNYNFELSLV